MNRRLKLGTFLGVGLYIHWSFGLMIAYIALTAYGDGLAGILYAITLLMGVYLCVTLHEYGHVLAARRFGIGAVDITLLPIGGVARLKSMPRIPWQELVVAVAGPAVNVVIVILLMCGLFTLCNEAVLIAFKQGITSEIFGGGIDQQTQETIEAVFLGRSFTSYAITLLGVNLMLVLFNMLPAFPMDGGRVFRSLLAMFLSYRRATWIASRVGLLCAAGMAFIALNSGFWMPVFIAIFIGYAGLAEARQVDTTESVRGLTVRQAMVTTNASIPMDTPLTQIFRVWHSNPMPALPVISDYGVVVGMLHLRDVQQAITTKKDALTPASELVDNKNYQGPARIDEPLETAIQRGSRQVRQIPVVDRDGYLMGILDLDSMLLRAELAADDLQRQESESSIQSEDLIQAEMLAPRNLPDSPRNLNHFDQTN
ncbi:site-2 protease family protein [Rubripirellula sp.]|nr:site-2 protease family protein [Rubripirellula sp.]MDB4749682.1 site-2 protease family protein [Rubripirellula sp.]